MFVQFKTNAEGVKTHLNVDNIELIRPIDKVRTELSLTSGTCIFVFEPIDVVLRKVSDSYNKLEENQTIFVVSSTNNELGIVTYYGGFTSREIAEKKVDDFSKSISRLSRGQIIFGIEEIPVVRDYELVF